MLVMKKATYTLFLIIFINSGVFGQTTWRELIKDGNSTKNEIIQSFKSEFPDIENEYYRAMQRAIDNNEDFFRTEEYGKFKPYVKFERFKNRVLNKLEDTDQLYEYYNSFNTYTDYNYQKLKQTKELRLKSSENTWKFIGPEGYVYLRGSGFGGGGRVDRLRFHPTDPETMFACSPAGGLWKTVDDGDNWMPLTDFTGVTAVSDLLIHPEHPDTLYLATGESDTWWMNGSIGVLKSIDGGLNWTKTGLELPISQHVRIQRLLMHPTQPDSIYAGTSHGIYVTGDGGDNWIKISSILDVWNMEFKPGDPYVIYVGASDGFYKSENAGGNFQKVYSNLPSLNIERVDVGVSKSSPDVVYAIFQGKNGANTLLGLYRSDNSGEDFSLVYNDKNLFWWDENELAGGIGGWEMAVSDVDANYIIVGGIHNWRSKDGGQSWERVGSHDSSIPASKWTHCDVHFLTFLPGDANTYFSCNDGGIYKTSDDGGSWELKIGSMSNYLTATLGNSAISENKFVTGTQDNSTVLYNGDSYVLVGSGDGQNCFFDRTDDNYIYITAQSGWTQMSGNGGYYWTHITNNEGNAAWATPFMQDPVNPATIYQARQKIFKSDNRGSSWQAVGSLEANYPFISMDICECDNSVIWAVESYSSSIYRLVGTEYEKISNPGQGGISTIVAHPNDPLRAYIALNSFNPASKVYETRDGGKTWANLSDGLPALPVNCIYYQRGSNDRIFVGLNIGLFYRDNESDGWVQMDDGLPHSEITDIDYYYPTNKLRVAVYGRGIWEYDNSANASTNVTKLNSEEVEIYPNPVADRLILKRRNNNPALVTIHDMKGQKLYEKMISEKQKEIDCHNLVSGIYIIRLITTNNEIYSSKFIKQ